MKFRLSPVAAAAFIVICSPAFADGRSDLKPELAGQEQAPSARLDALEQKLNAVQQQVAANGPREPAADSDEPRVRFAPGSGLMFGTPANNVTLYGLIDISYVRTDHADAKGDTVTGPRVAWFSGNKWGLDGKRKLAGTDLSMIFKLESEFENQTGNMDTPGVLFNRDAWVGVESESLGKLTFGRQNAVARDISGIYSDPYTSAKVTTEEGGYTNNNNYKQLIFYAGSATGTRLNNGVVWKKAFKSGLVAAFGYQFGGIPGDFSNGTTETAALGYNAGPLHIAGYATTAKVAGLTNNSVSFGGNYQIGEVRLNAGVYRYRAEQAALGDRNDKAYTVSAKFAPVGKFDYELGYQVMKADNAAVNGGGNVFNAFSNVTGAKATATGSRSTVYASAFYRFDKITDLYVVADRLRLYDGYKYAATNGFNSQVEMGIGLRTKF